MTRFYIQPGPDTPGHLKERIERESAAYVLPIPQRPPTGLLGLLTGLLAGALGWPIKGRGKRSQSADREELLRKASLGQQAAQDHSDLDDDAWLAKIEDAEAYQMTSEEALRYEISRRRLPTRIV